MILFSAMKRMDSFIVAKYRSISGTGVSYFHGLPVYDRYMGAGGG